MENYFENLTDKWKQYMDIISNEKPEFLNEYINTKEMQKQKYIGIANGLHYSKIAGNIVFNSSLNHSVAVALIIWNFTKSKKQTLAGLFHDIATPAFKHAIDYIYGDYKNQEATENLTKDIISGSTEIMKLLNRDGISIEEVCNYHIYPIADNDTPKLSADRLEYTLSNGLGIQKNIYEMNDIKEIYENIEIQTNEEGTEELGFKDIKMAEKFLFEMSILSKHYRCNAASYTKQFLADLIKLMVEKNLITLDDLYNLTEKEIIEKIENCNMEEISNPFKVWKNASSIKTSDTSIEGKYMVDGEHDKLRYINPLVDVNGKYIRAYDISQKAKEYIDDAINYKPAKYGYLDFSPK